MKTINNFCDSKARPERSCKYLPHSTQIEVPLLFRWHFSCCSANSFAFSSL